MTQAPTGILQQPQLLRLLVSESATFQSVVGVSTAAEALVHIEYPLTEDDFHHKPRAIISEHLQFNRILQGTSNSVSYTHLTLPTILLV